MNKSIQKSRKQVHNKSNKKNYSKLSTKYVDLGTITSISCCNAIDEIDFGKLIKAKTLLPLIILLFHKNNASQLWLVSHKNYIHKSFKINESDAMGYSMEKATRNTVDWKKNC